MNAPRRSSSPCRSVWVRVCPCVLLFASPVLSQAPFDSDEVFARRGLSIVARIGVADYVAPVKPGLWHPVWITIRSTGETDFRGEIVLRQQYNSLRVSVPIDVPRGATKRTLAYFRLSTIDPRLSMVVYGEAGLGGRRRSLTRDPLPIASRIEGPSDRVVVILAEETGDFGFLRRSSEGATDEVASGVRDAWVAYGRPELIPPEPIALEGIDAIVITTPEVVRLTEAQASAIRAWVAGGGRLLIAAGRHRAIVEQSALRGAFGVEFAEPGSTSMAAALGRDDADPAAEDVIVSWPRGEWDHIALGDERRPLIVGKEFGRGWVHFSAVALDEYVLNAINADPRSETLWPSILENPSGRGDLQLIADETAEGLGQVMQMPFVVSLAGAAWVFTYLTIYILLAVPVNWYVCRRMGRREWAWPIAVTLALGFAAYGYLSGARSQGQSFKINEIAFISHAAGDRARVTSLATVFSPHRFRADLSSPAPMLPTAISASIDPYGYGGGDLYEDTPFGVRFDAAGAPSVERFSLHPWSARNVRADFSPDLAPMVRIATPLELDAGDPRRIRGAVANESRTTFDRWWIGYRGRWWIGADSLEPGETAAVDDLQLTPATDIGALVRDIVGLEFLTNPSSGNQVYIAGRSVNPGDFQARVFAVDSLAWNRVRRQAGLRREFVFLGSASGGVSPLLDSIDRGERQSRTIYEQALEAAPTIVVRGEALNLISWRAALLDAKDDVLANRPPYAYYGMVDADAAPDLWFPTDVAEARLSPDTRPEPEPDARLRLSVEIGSYPNSVETFWSQKGGNEAHQVVGCPVMARNFRTSQWEPLKLDDDGAVEFGPAVDYLDPIERAIFLRFDARLSGVLFRPHNKPKVGEPKRGDEIFDIAPAAPGAPAAPSN